MYATPRDRERGRKRREGEREGGGLQAEHFMRSKESRNDTQCVFVFVSLLPSLSLSTCLSLMHKHSPSHECCLSLPPTHTNTNTHNCYFYTRILMCAQSTSLTHSLSRMHTRTHARAHTRTHIRTLSFSLSLSLIHARCFLRPHTAHLILIYHSLSTGTRSARALLLAC